MIELNRKKIYLLGVAAIVALLFASRLDFIIGSSFTQGEVLDFESGRSVKWPIVEFQHNNYIYTFEGVSNDDLEMNEKVKVIFKQDDPSDARVFSFVGFLLPPLLWSILPLVLWTAAVYSFLTKKTIIQVPFRFWKSDKRK